MPVTVGRQALASAHHRDGIAIISIARASTTRHPGIVGLLLAGSWVLLGGAIARHNGAYTRPALAAAVGAWAMLAGAVAITVVRSRRSDGPEGSAASGRPEPRGITVGPAVPAMLGAGLLGAVAWDAGIYGQGSALTWSRALAVVACLAALLAAGTDADDLPTRTRAVVLSLVAATVAGLLMLAASPAPFIDVWVILQQATDGLLQASNPYTACWTGNTDPVTDCVHPYPPGVTLLLLPFRVVTGDVRLGLLVALLASVASLVSVATAPDPAGSRTHRWLTSLGVAGPLALVLLVQPKWLFLLEQSWTEPLVVALVAGMAAAVLAGRHRLAIGLFALALASKQHVALLLPLAAWWPAFGLRRTALAAGVAGAIAVPWFLADPNAFVDDVLRFHLDLPARADSLSLNSLAMESGGQIALAVVVVATLTALGLAMLLPRDAFGFSLGAAFVLSTFSLLNKQVFFNHHTFVLGLVVLALATRCRPPSPAGASPPPDGLGDDHGDP